MRPWLGILVFSWVGYMNPHRYCWGPAHDFPFAQIVAVATLAGFFFTRDKDRLHFERESVLILLLWIVFTVTTFSAVYHDSAWLMWQKTSKVLLMVLLTIPLIIDREKLRHLLLTIALSLGLLGAKGGIFSIMTAGSYNVRGPDDSFISGEGDFGLALNMTLPLLFYLAKNETNKNLKIVLYVTFVLSIVSVIFTYRRGAFLALAAVLFLLLVKANRKMWAALVLAVGVLIGSYAVTDKWTERMGTIETYEEDASSMGRVNAWKTAWNVAKDRPFSGVGFDGLTGWVVDTYSPSPGQTASDVHSIYFEVLGEHGFIGFGLFVLMLMTALLSTRRIKKDFSTSPDHQWLCNYADMIQISIIAYMVGGAFLGRAYFDLFYHLVAITVVIKVLAYKEEMDIELNESCDYGPAEEKPGLITPAKPAQFYQRI